MNLNKVELVGGLTKPPELRFTQGGYPFVTFTLAVNGTRYDSKERSDVVTTQYIGCQLWGHLATVLAEELERAVGERLYVLGELDQSEWEDKDGKRQSRTRVKVMHWLRIDPRTSDSRQQAVAESWGPDEAPF